MTTEQQIKILECAAKTCGLEKAPVFSDGSRDIAMRNRWNPLISPADCAEMCTELRISVLYEYDPRTTRSRRASVRLV